MRKAPGLSWKEMSAFQREVLAVSVFSDKGKGQSQVHAPGCNCLGVGVDAWGRRRRAWSMLH